MKTVHRLVSTLATLALILLVSPATSQAGTIVYTDRNAFLAAAGPTTLTSFDQPTACTPDAVFPQFLCHADYGAVTVAYDNFYFFILAGGVTQVPYVPVSLIGIFATFEQPTLMFGLDVMAGGPPGAPLFVIYTTGLDSAFPVFGPGFLGFRSTDSTPFTGFAASPGAGVGTLDNLVISVPEHSSTALFLSIALIALTVGRRRFGSA
jgi:hypothetical protein